MKQKDERSLPHAIPHHHIIYRFFPFLIWLKEYRASFLRSDAISGLTVAVVLIPQAMAYAMLAGMPPVYGLYAAAVTPFIAGLWGSSLKINIAAAPEKGKANKELIKLLAKLLNKPKSAIEIVSGHHNNRKEIHVAAMNPQQLINSLAEYL